MKNTISIIALILYAVCSAFDVYASEHHGNRVCKVFLMPLLILFYVLRVRSDALILALCAALVFGWIGDMCLLKKGKWWFVFGLTAFMFGHFCYISVFIRDILGFRLASVYYFSIVPYLIYLAVTMIKIIPHAGRKMKYPVMVYMIVLLIMSWSAMLRSFAIGNYVTWVGTVLFVISDTLIACRNFLKTGNTGIMLTYVLAQFLIIGGYLF